MTSFTHPKGEGCARRQADQALAVPATPASAVDGPSGFDPSREELASEDFGGLSLEATLQAIYDEEVNVSITTMWDGGFDLSIGGAPGWAEPKLVGCVYGAHNIAPWLRLAFNEAYGADPDALTGCADDQTFADVPVEVIRDALAAGTQRAETNEDLAQSKGCQSGPKGNAQNTPGEHS